MVKTVPGWLSQEIFELSSYLPIENCFKLSYITIKYNLYFLVFYGSYLNTKHRVIFSFHLSF
jgi:hypothetical protein